MAMMAKAAEGRKRYAIEVTVAGQYFDIPFSLSSNARVEVDVWVPNNTQNRYIISSSNDNINSFFEVLTYYSFFLNRRYGGYFGGQTFGASAEKWHNLVCDGRYTYLDGILVNTIPSSSFAAPNTNSTRVFGMLAGGINQASPVGTKIAALKIDDGENHADLAPVLAGSTQFSQTPAPQNGFWCGALERYFHSLTSAPFGAREVE